MKIDNNRGPTFRKVYHWQQCIRLHRALAYPFSRRATATTTDYHLSQLTIRIEMTFGIFMNKWRLFQRPFR